MSLPETYVLLDLETTGANPVSDRITEIAVVRVERGKTVARWETLVQPERDIPPFIQRIIGITDAMVADAPLFAELAPRVRELLKDAVLIAHNARFDYGFLRHAFQRLGENFEAPVLCTVKLSRALYPQHHRHGLDALIERHGLVCDARHRAMGDVQALEHFLQLATTDFPAATLARACTRAMKAPRRPTALPEGVLEGLPDAPGVYIFLGEQRETLFVGRSASVRARVMEHFGHIERDNREGALARKVHHLDWVQTPGELSALLLEAELIRARRPRHNRFPESGEAPFALRITPRRKSAPLLVRAPIEQTDPADWDGLYGAFRTRKEANAVLRELARLYRLCPRRLGLESDGRGACAAYPARCAGVCARRETPEEHDARFLGGFASMGVRAWPWPGAVVVSERSEHNDDVAFHVFDRWCHLGSADSEQALAELLAAPPPRRFCLDTWRLLQRWLDVPGNADKMVPA